MRNAAAIFCAISSCTSRTSFISRSYRSDHSGNSVAASAGIEIALQSLERRLELGRALKAKVAIFLQRLADNATQLLRQRRIDLRHQRRIAIQNRFEDDGGCLALERQESRRHLIEHGPEREEIGARVGDLSTCLFG